MHYVVLRERAHDWDWSRPMRRQDGWEAHAAFMDALASERFVILGGPLGDEDTAKRVIHVIEAPDESAVRARLAEDPWTPRLLRTVSIEPLTLLLG